MSRTETKTAPAALTTAERFVLNRLASGHTNAQIGHHLGRSEKTVRNQLTRIYAKLGVANRVEAVARHLRKEYGRAP
jgi:DNA-binding NarL/FixJ family response regulator